MNKKTTSPSIFVSSSTFHVSPPGKWWFKHFFYSLLLTDFEFEKKKRELNGVLVNRGDSYSRKFLDKLKEHMLPCAGLFHILHSSLKERLFLNCMVGKGGFPFQSLQTERWVINTAAAHRISVNRTVAQGFTGNNSLELFCYTVFYS